MFNKLSNFFQTNDICDENNIMYIIKVKGTQITEFHLDDGRVITKYISLKECKNQLSDAFIPINKGILLNKHYIKCINVRTYHLLNGETLEGKIKSKRLIQTLERDI